MNKAHRLLSRSLSIGDVRTYIQDYPFKRLTAIPAAVAFAWVRDACPTAPLSALGRADPDNFEIDQNAWLNKAFVVVGEDWSGRLAITNWDGIFSLWVETLE